MGLPTETEIAMTLVLYNADHENPDEHVLREHWDSWWNHVLPRANMGRYLRMARAVLALKQTIDATPVDFAGLDTALDELRKPVDEVRE